MTEFQQKIKEIFSDNGIDLMDSDMENLGTAISDTLYMISEKIEDEEQYATRTIQSIRDSRSSVEEALKSEE